MAFVAAVSLFTATDANAQLIEPFTYRAPLDPHRILQLPDFMMQSHERTDFVIQRSVFAPGPGGWHIHPGPSLIYVIQGQIKLQKFSEQEGCFETPVFGPGQSYFEIGDEVHAAVVVSAESAVLMVPTSLRNRSRPSGSNLQYPRTSGTTD
jgi:quercetin dioxygenase-like cupin family protein